MKPSIQSGWQRNRQGNRQRSREIHREEEEIQPENLKDQVEHLEEEARMVIPGVQALFGFQLIAVFNAVFKTDLTLFEKELHLAALLFVALAILFTLTPAAYHRQVEPNYVSDSLARLGSKSLTRGMFSLILGISLDVYVISRLITESVAISFAIALVVLSAFFGAWFVFPKLAERRASDQHFAG